MDKCSASATFVAKYFKDQNASTDEETEDHEDIEHLTNDVDHDWIFSDFA